MRKQQDEAERWLDGQKEREEFSQWALEQAPEGEITMDLVDATALLVLARYGKPGYYNFGLPLDGTTRLLDGLLKVLPAEHQVWIEMVEAGYRKHLAPFLKAEDE